MALVEIVFDVKPDKKIVPKGDHRRQVKEGDTVIFRWPNATGRISFSGPNPFGQEELAWNTPHTVVKAFDSSPSANNVYPYNCSLELEGETLTSVSGGEMEIIRT